MTTRNPKTVWERQSLREMALAWARMNLGVDMYVQGARGRGVMLWLRLGCGAHTMLAHGDIDAALAEAEEKLDQLKAKLREDCANWKARQGSNY